MTCYSYVAGFFIFCDNCLLKKQEKTQVESKIEIPPKK